MKSLLDDLKRDLVVAVVVGVLLISGVVPGLADATTCEAVGVASR